jgi:opacity protein-like surface antigen
MSRSRTLAAALVLLSVGAASQAQAQGAPPPGPTPPAPAQQGYAQPGQPAQPGYAQPGYAQQGYAPPPPAEAPPAPGRRPAELYLLIGLGGAVCDNEKPDSDCPVDGGGAFGLGGFWRFHDNWAVGLELAAWSFNVRDEWRGQLQNDADDVKFSSFYISPLARWYWFDEGMVDPYLQAGIGLGTVTAEAKNQNATYEYNARGIAYSLGIGVDFHVSKLFRIGPQLLGYLHVSSEICDNPAGAGETCRDPGKNPDGDREGLALPWRFVAVGTFMLGDP